MSKIKSEKLFGEIFANSTSFANISASNDVYIANELRTSLGVPDFVLLTQVDYKKLEAYARSYGAVRMSGKYAAIVSYIAKNDEAEIIELPRLLSQRAGEVTAALRQLNEQGVLDLDNTVNGTVRLNKAFNIPIINSIAIELKLSSWQKALWQASRNGIQFSSSYVVMPSDKLELLASKVDLFRSNNVSTAVFDVENMELTSIYREDKENLRTSRYYVEALDSMARNITAFDRITF